jgi:Photosynthesis system II assembly factor YCF48
MQSVPKIVTDRLQVAPAVKTHPDADLLTAFSERTLAERDRALVLQHLAACSDCRDIVVLALPEPEAVDQVLAPAPRYGFAWPAQRWALIAAGIIAIGSLGLITYRKSTHAPTTAYLAPPKTIKQAEGQAPVLTAESTSRKQNNHGGAAPAVVLSPDRVAKSSPAASAAQQLGRAGLNLVPATHGPKAQWQNNFQANNAQNYSFQKTPVPLAASPRQPPNAFLEADTSAPATAQAASVQSQPAQSELQAQDREALALPAQGMPLQPSAGGQAQAVVRAKDSGTVVFGQSKVAVGSVPPPPASGSFAMAPPNASWTITAGGLERSLDQGKTWQNVDVHNAPAAASYGGSLDQPAGRAAAIADDKKISAQQAALPTVFRAVAANGAEVWAGGSNGALYHSVDAGGHWERVVPSSAGNSLTGDVITLDFPDSLHGRVATSTGEIWVTRNAGETWQKQ